MKMNLSRWRLPLLLGLPVLVSLPFYFLWPDWWLWLLFAIGCGLGGLILILDETVFWRWYAENQSLNRLLMTRSLVFIGIYVLLAIYIVTSSGSPLGMGIVFCLGLGLALEMWWLRLKAPEWQQRFGWQIDYQFTSNQINQLVYGFSVFVGILAVLIGLT